MDMLVRLYALPDSTSLYRELEEKGIVVCRAMTPDKERILAWVRERIPSWTSECDVCFSRLPVSMFVAVRGRDILGIACYDATAKDFFGPALVAEEECGQRIGKALLLRCMEAMREEGYGYAVIGAVGPADFYRKCVGAIEIPDSTPGVYKDFIGAMGR